MDPDDPYPDVPEDADGFDRLVKLLSDLDDTHLEKASLLVLAARTEHAYAVANDEAPEHVPFDEFSELVVEEYNDISEVGDD